MLAHSARGVLGDRAGFGTNINLWPLAGVVKGCEWPDEVGKSIYVVKQEKIA